MSVNCLESAPLGFVFGRRIARHHFINPQALTHHLLHAARYGGVHLLLFGQIRLDSSGPLAGTMRV